MNPGGVDSTIFHQQVAALNTRFPFFAAYRVVAYVWSPT